jgi:regulation of enolase protein 1 (concanavalin A-like superfamily)
MNASVRFRLFCLFCAMFILIMAWPYTPAGQTLALDDVVLWTAAASPADVHGDWARVADATAAGGVMLSNRDRGRGKVTPPLASPANYFEMRFTAKGSTAYYLWIRMRAQGNSNSNDSVHVQFSDSVDASGQSTLRIGTASSAEVLLQNGSSGGAPQGWGWADNGWDSRGSPIYFAGDGAHVVRIQQREDGVEIDQVVLSPVTFASSAPGSYQSDTRLLPQARSLGPSVSAATSVIRVAAAAAGRTYGTWQTMSDATAAGSQALRNGDTGAAKIAPALSNPASYFEATFNADAGRPYHVWLRMRADGNSTANDSVHVQFSDSMTSAASPTARIGTSSSLEMLLQDGPTAPAPYKWGWTDNGWDMLGTHVYFASSGVHTIRVQQREDGAAIDQIVISPDTYLTIPPGWTHNDQTIYGASQSPSTNLPPSVTLAAPANGASYTAPAIVTLTATASDPENRLSKVEFYNGSTLLGSDASAPFGWTWSGVAAGSYQLRAVAVDADGASTGSATSTIAVTAPSANQPPTVSLTAPANGATYASPATITLSATAFDPEGRLARVDFYNGSALLSSDTTSPFSYVWSGVAAGTYSVRAVARDSDGASTNSATVSVTVTAATTLPNGQQNQDIGGPAIAGSVQYNAGTYTIRAAGADIWYTSDQFHYVYRPITGDVVITARVASLQSVHQWTKAGVMIRETLTAGSRHAFAHATGGNGYWLTRRVDTSGVSSLTAVGSSGSAPGWVRLIRRGNTFEMYRSNDGVSWTAFDSVQITMASTVYIGLAVTSHNVSTSTTAVFDNLSVTSPANLAPSVTLTAPANGSTFTAPATITLSATASDPENRLAKVDFYSGSTLLASDTTAPFSFPWSSVAAGTYQLKAVATDADGASASTATATVTVSTTSTSTSTKRVAFTASVDHATVTSYLLEVFPSTANPATATAIASSDLGKPTPSGTNEIVVDRTTFLNNLAPGSYLITVASVGAGGKSRSTAIAFTR